MAIFEITLLFLGSIIGAGFATGAEIVTFFGKFQLPICVISIIAGVAMFLIMVWQILLHTTPKKNNKQFKAAFLIDVVFVMIYLILFTAMTAGIAQITNFWITPFSLLLSALIANLNFQKLSHFNTFIVSGIIALIITTTLPWINLNVKISNSFQFQTLIQTCLSAILYAGLNCFTLPELIHTTSQKYPRKILIYACLITSAVITFLLELILNAIQASNTTNASMPIISIAPTPITTMTVLLAILTSQYTTLFALIQRTYKIFPKTKSRPRLTTVCLCLCAFLGSFCGFNRIIQFGYPLIGIITCFYLLFSSWRRF